MPGTLIRKPTAENYDTQIAQINARLDKVQSYYILDRSASSTGSDVQVRAGTIDGNILLPSNWNNLVNLIRTGNNNANIKFYFVYDRNGKRYISDMNITINRNEQSSQNIVSLTNCTQHNSGGTSTLDTVSIESTITEGAHVAVTWYYSNFKSISLT